MVRPRIFRPPNPLAKAVRSPEGPLLEDLIAESERRIAGLIPALRAQVDDHLEQLTLLAAASDDTLRDSLDEIEGHALAIADVAGAAGLVDIGRVAAGVAAMVLGCAEVGIWRPDALKVHLNALAALKINPGGAEQLIERLRAMRLAIGLLD